MLKQYLNEKRLFPAGLSRSAQTISECRGNETIMKLHPLKIRNLESKYPVIQAGMGVKIGSAELAAAVVQCGGFGTIASVGLGDVERGKYHFVEECNNKFSDEIHRAQALCQGKKPLGVNVMVALSNYQEIPYL